MAEPRDSPGADADQEFEPSAEQMVHDYDDEGTLEEEENMSNGTSDNDELEDLEKEGDMPLETLLAMYGYGGTPDHSSEHSHQNSHGSTSEEDILNNQDLTLDKEEVARDVLKDDDCSETSVDELLEQVQPSSTVRLLNYSRSQNTQGDDDEDEDEDYMPGDEEVAWKKAIQVGPDYQAAVPEIVNGTTAKIDEIPGEAIVMAADYGKSCRSIISTDYHFWKEGGGKNLTDACAAEARLLWDPNTLLENQVVDYLDAVTKWKMCDAEGVDAIPEGVGVKDDEQALYLLLQSDFNTEEALRRRKMQTTPATEPLSLWSEEECTNFESGLRIHGKNFFLIQQNKVRSKSVGELVQFYYFWKKTERQQAFCNRGKLERKKYAMNPGVTDYTDRFADHFEEDSKEDSNGCSCTPPLTEDNGPATLTVKEEDEEPATESQSVTLKRPHPSDETTDTNEPTVEMEEAKRLKLQTTNGFQANKMAQVGI